MSAPGATHERLRLDLDALAILSGHGQTLHLVDWLRPDVARCDLASFRLFVGDAKDTEAPADTETLRRLRAYLAVAGRAARLGWDATFAVAHADPAARWLCELDWLASRLGLVVADRGRDVLAADVTISWILVASLGFTPTEARLLSS